jgi:hypothetical protein
MRSRSTRRFREALARLPEPVRRRAREAYRLFLRHPHHPGLRFKRVHATEPIWAVRITRDYRALGVQAGDEMIWFWIGSHADYDRLLGQL